MSCCASREGAGYFFERARSQKARPRPCKQVPFTVSGRRAKRKHSASLNCSTQLFSSVLSGSACRTRPYADAKATQIFLGRTELHGAVFFSCRFLFCFKFFLGLFPCVLCASLCLAAWQFTDNPAKRLALLKALLSTNRVLTERTQEVVRVTGMAGLAGSRRGFPVNTLCEAVVFADALQLSWSSP